MLDRLAPDQPCRSSPRGPGLTAHPQRCPTVDLTLARASGGEVIATLQPRTRSQIRRAVRRRGAVETEVAAGSERALAFLDELIDLYQRRWRREGLPGAFASPRFRGFHRDLIRRLAARCGNARASALRLGTVGRIYYNLVQGREVLSYQMGLMATSDPKLKPGFVAHAA